MAVDADTKLIVGYLVGLCDGGYASEFMRDVADRLTHRVQLTSDGHRSYMYGAERAGEARYRPPVCLAANPHPVCGDPDPAHISTSYVERSNLTMRMSMGRFTRLTNAFRNKIDNLKHSVALNFVY